MKPGSDTPPPDDEKSPETGDQRGGKADPKPSHAAQDPEQMRREAMAILLRIARSRNQKALVKVRAATMLLQATAKRAAADAAAGAAETDDAVRTASLEALERLGRTTNDADQAGDQREDDTTPRA